MENVIAVQGLTKSYRSGFWLTKHQALKGASFNVRAHRITGFVGSNGAGKTSTIRCLLGFTKLDGGEVHFFDGQPLSSAVRKRIGYLPEQPNFYDHLSGSEFLSFHAGLSGVRLTRDQILAELSRVHLEHVADRKLREYSKGMLQRIGLVQALIHHPELLILDEPMSGLDPDGRRLVKDLLRSVAVQGVSLFFSTHLLDDVEDLCDDVVMMAKGEIKYCGELNKILHQKGASFQVTITQNGSQSQHVFTSQEQMNESVKKWLSDGGMVTEIKPVRKKLEDVYADFSRENLL